MKKYLKFSGIAAAVVALLGWVLMMACPAVLVKNGNSTTVVASGVEAIFGGDSNLAPTAIVAWIFVLLAFLALVAAFVLPFFKINVLDKFAGAINLGALALLFVSGILAFCTKSSFVSQNNGWGILGSMDPLIGAGWVFAGIFLIVAGALAILPAVFAFIDSNKK